MKSYEEFIKNYEAGIYHKYANGGQQIKQEGGEAFAIVGIEDEGEIKTVIKKAQFAHRTYISNKTLFVTNQAKSIFIEAIKTLVEPQYIIGTVISLFTPKIRQNLIKRFNHMAFRLISPEIYKEIHRTPFGNELQYLIFEITRHLVSEESADRFAEIVSTIIENDDAYRYRIMDLFSETTIEKLKDIKELKRLITLSNDRDTCRLVKKKKYDLYIILRVALYIPKIKKAYLSALDNLTISNLQLKDEDIYWCSYKKDYDFMGMNWEQRQEYAKNKGWIFPEQIK